MKQQKEK